MDFLRGYAALLDYRYWLTLTPVPLGPSLVGGVFAFFSWFLVVGAALYLAGYWLKKRDKLKAGLANGFAYLFWSTGLMGLLLLFFAYEQVPLFSMRLWVLCLLVVFSVRLARLAIRVVKEYPKQRDQLEQKQRFEKYLPVRK